MDWDYDWPFFVVFCILLLILLTVVLLLIFAPCVLNHTWLSGNVFCPSCGRQVVAVCPVCHDNCFGDFCNDCGTPVLRPSKGE